MGGAHCALVNCSAKKSKNKGLSFFKIPKKGVNDEWRIQLLHKINRADDGFNADTARICSRHFLDSCIQITQKGVKKLIPGSLPTEEMPVKSVETPRPLSRKAPTDREPPLQPLRVSYFTLDDVRKDASRLISPWVKALVCFPCRQRGTFPMTFLQMHWQIGLDESNMCAKSSHFPLDYPYLEQKTQAFCCFHFNCKEVVTTLSNFPLKTFFFFPSKVIIYLLCFAIINMQ